ncbi:MAG: DUF4864 domain-containing protein [Chthoniobacterales bacterium]|nr:DUF4864 domain-containing protein [Chthoniobacterales bacterium]
MSRRWKIFSLLFFFALCAAAMVATEAVRRHTAPPAGQELLAVINRQLSAFRAADFRGAYQHSAAVVQQKFSLVEFERMVRRDFNSMTQIGKVELGAIRVDGATAFAQVFLTAPDGIVHGYLYSFTAEGDGWKIDGVQSLGVMPARRPAGLRV